LKGQSYTCNTGIKNVYLEELWGYKSENIQFLDASCLLYDYSNNLIETIDFRNTISTTKAVIHSGDIIDYNKKSGKHTIKIKLNLLPKNIKSLFFTISAWHTTLKDIIQPHILFIDSDINQELCRYQYVDKKTDENTAVIMVKLYREDGKWIVKAIGNIGKGCAGFYDDIKRDIAKYF